MPAITERICEMRLLLSPMEIEEFKKEFPEFKWEAGDTKILWNANDLEEVAMARKAFEAYRKKHPGSLVYKVDMNDKGSEVIKDFDPNAEMIVIHDRMVGG